MRTDRKIAPQSPAPHRPDFRAQATITRGSWPDIEPLPRAQGCTWSASVITNPMCDYYLGGKDNFAVDRAAAEQVMETFPDILVSVRAQRAFLGRAVHYLVAEAGIRQFLDIGTGLPSVNNAHEVAQRIAPETRVVYVDNDPIVLLHARALLASSPEGATAYIDADLRDTGMILAQAPGSWTSASRSRSCCSGCCTASPTRTTRPRSSRLVRRRAGGQLPRDRAPGQRRRHRADGHLDAELQRPRGRSAHRAQPRRGLRLLRRPGPAGTRRGAAAPVAGRPAAPAPAANWPTTAG